MKEDAGAEQAESGAPVHLALEHLDVHGALNLAGAVGQGEAVGNGLLVVADAGAAIARAERAEAALDAERAERRALTDELTAAVPAQPARTRTRTRTTTEKQS